MKKDEQAEDEAPEAPTGIPDAKSSARAITPIPEEPDRPARPPGLTQMTPSARLRLQLVIDEDDTGHKKKIQIVDETPAPIKPPSDMVPFVKTEIRDVRSLGRWIAFTGLMTLTVGALTGLSYATGGGSVAHVVVGILATANAFWLLAAAFAFHRVTRAEKGRLARHHLVGGFGLLRSAFLLKAILLFSAMALGCFGFSLAASLLFLL